METEKKNQIYTFRVYANIDDEHANSVRNDNAPVSTKNENLLILLLFFTPFT